MTRIIALAFLALLSSLTLAVPASASPAVGPAVPSTPRVHVCNDAFAHNLDEVGYMAARGLYSECLSAHVIEPDPEQSTKAEDPKRTANLVCHTYSVSFGRVSAPRVCMNTAASR